MAENKDPLKQEQPPLAATGGVRAAPAAVEPPKDAQVLKGATAHNIVLKGGGYATLQKGDPVPADISDESLKRLQDSGVLDNEHPGVDWETLAAIGTGPAPAPEAAKMREAYAADPAPVAPEA